ncbi:septum formation initiator family protein [Paenibacillus sp. 32O-W]|uniref:FtsB family cell division protein n=1 Tax=Paenibacillus sp. 32O-W TaxID=1695218 RepID=UPI00119EADD0|nr:septum formation initiator family protein [Paenibacillus sp. 32O-W]
MVQAKNASKKNTSTIGARRRIRLLMIVVCCVLLWAGITILDQSDKLAENSAKLVTLETKLAEVEKINEESRMELDRLNDPEYQEEKARKDLQVAREGETVFDVVKPAP